MFTQCSNCKAIFRVSMREVTVSQGFLRCGECLEVFDSSHNLSTTMQEPFVDVDVKKTSQVKNISHENLQTISALDDWQSVPSEAPSDDRINLKKKPSEKPKTKTKSKSNISNLKTRGTEEIDVDTNTVDIKIKKESSITWPKVAVGLLSLLLIFQLAYNLRHIFSDSNKYDHTKIHMLNHNVFAHPIDKNVLLISASIENTAEFDQPFPILEVRLTNSKAELVALRRFTPDEYLDDYSDSSLLTKNRATSIKLKIQDPGNQATRFQFDFL